MLNLCPPAIIYLIFSLTQILIDTYKGLYNTAFMKVIVASMVTLLLNILCEKGLGVVSWIIVFIPFILMTVIVSFLLYYFGLNASTGKSNTNTTTDSSGNIIVYNPYYNASINPVYYNSPNIIIPKPPTTPPPPTTTTTTLTHSVVPITTSDPSYQS